MKQLDLPKIIEAFNVRDYDAVRDFGIEEWNFALERRRYVRGLMQRNFGYDDPYEAILRLFKNPTFCRSSRADEIYGAAVGDLTNYCAWCLRDIVQSDQEVATECEAESNGPTPVVSIHEPGSVEWFHDFREQDEAYNPKFLHSSFNDLLVSGPFESDIAYVEIMLSAPDETIIQDFKDWLSRIRRRPEFSNSPVRRFTAKELARWASNRVLPFLDLQIASDFFGEPIAQHALGNMLFPLQNVDVAEKVRKTVAPLAQELTSEPLVEALKAAANAMRRARVRKDSDPSFLPE